MQLVDQDEYDEENENCMYLEVENRLVRKFRLTFPVHFKLFIKEKFSLVSVDNNSERPDPLFLPNPLLKN